FGTGAVRGQRARGSDRESVAAVAAEGSGDDDWQGARHRGEPLPVAVGELVAGERAADGLVVGDGPLLLRVEGAERGLRRRGRGRARLLLRAVAAGQRQREQEGAGAPVDSPAMRVLVTGASGFVGRALVEALRHGERSYEVHAVERSAGDLAEPGIADAALAGGRPETVVHAAARIGVLRCEEEPLPALR